MLLMLLSYQICTILTYVVALCVVLPDVIGVLFGVVLCYNCVVVLY